jgi:hypothetical protein
MNTLAIQKKELRRNKLIAEKLHHLLDALHLAAHKLNEVSEKVKEKKLQDLIFGLAVEAFQYYKELQSYVQTLEGEPAIMQHTENCSLKWHQENMIGEDEELQNEMVTSNKEDILRNCLHIEKQLMKEFRLLLNDAYIPSDLRKLIQHQSNGLLYSFVKLKMLKSSTPSYRAWKMGLLF